MNNQTKGLSKEQRLVLYLSRLTFSQELIEDIQIDISSGVDWGEVVKYAVNSRTVTLVYYNLNKHELDYHLPKYIRSLFECYTIGIKEQNRLYSEELRKIENAFKENQIKCFPVKGAYLIDHLYRTYGIRYMGDADFIVRKKDISELIRVMEQLGYIQGKYNQKEKRVIKISRKEEIMWQLKMSNLHPFEKICGSEYLNTFKLDFRFALDDSLDTVSVDELIEASNGCTINPEHGLVHLCTHLYDEAKHSIDIFTGKDLNLIKFCDIREYILKYVTPEVKQKTLEFVKIHHYEKQVFYTFFYLNQIYGDGYEEEWMKELNIGDTSFMYTYGENTNAENKVWNKNFFDRLFSSNNADEMKDLPSLLQVRDGKKKYK